MTSVQIAESDAQIAGCFPVMRELRPHITETTFVPRVREQQQGGYVLAYVQEGDRVVSAAGYRIIENLVSGRVLYVDDLVTLEERRSEGHGKVLLDWLFEQGRQQGCHYLELDSGVQRFHAHRFYMANRMIISAHHFRLKLPPASRSRTRARELADQYVAGGDSVGWFEPLYAEAGGDADTIPWADLRANPNLVEWIAVRRPEGAGRTALVVGCGLGDDAEFLAGKDFRVTAFDISPTAIDWCRRRYPGSRVAYEARDLFQSPDAWEGAFDLVVEAYTLQVLPPEPRAQAMRRMAGWVSPGGELLLISRAREAHEPEGRMPWPLTRGELSGFESAGLSLGRFEDFRDDEDPPVRRFRASYSKT